MCAHDGRLKNVENQNLHSKRLNVFSLTVNMFLQFFLFITLHNIRI